MGKLSRTLALDLKRDYGRVDINNIFTQGKTR
jgi:hypothetical protein